MFWDRVAGVYGLFVHFYNRRAHRELKQIVEGLISPEDEVLECACGTGLLSEAIAGRCHHLMATDVSEAMLEKARQNLSAFPNVSYRLCDIASLPFADASFDKAVAGNVIHLLEDPTQALAQLDRVVRPGGKLIIATYLNKDKAGRQNGFTRVIQRAGAGFRRQFTEESYQQFFWEAGYACVSVQVARGKIPCGVAVLEKKIREKTVS